MISGIELRLLSLYTVTLVSGPCLIIAKSEMYEKSLSAVLH